MIYQHTSGQRIAPVPGSHEARRLADSDEWQRVDQPNETVPDAHPEAPDVSALKAEWAEHARALGIPSYEIDGMTKAELIERTTGDGTD